MASKSDIKSGAGAGNVKRAIQEAKKNSTIINLVSVVNNRGVYYATFTGYGIIEKGGVIIPLDATYYLINSYNYYAGEQGRKGNLIFINVKDGNDGNTDESKIIFSWSYNTDTGEIIIIK